MPPCSTWGKEAKNNYNFDITLEIMFLSHDHPLPPQVTEISHIISAACLTYLEDTLKIIFIPQKIHPRELSKNRKTSFFMIKIVYLIIRGIL